MRAYRETFRRHRLLYLLPALLVAVAVGAASYKAPTYLASASLWVDNDAATSSSLAVTPNGSQPGTPSAEEQSVLTELLTTSKFDAAVISGAGLGKADTNSPLLALVKGVTSSTPGPQVLQVSDLGPSPTVAYKLVKSVLTQLQGFSQQWAHDFASSAVAYYQAQVNSATQSVNQAKAATGSSTGGSAATATASEALASAASALSQAQAQASDHSGFSTNMVLGAPSASAAPLTGYKSIIMKAFGGAIAALLASALIIAIRTPAGHDEWDAEMADAGWNGAGGPFRATIAGGHPGTPGTSPVPVTPPAPMSPHAPMGEAPGNHAFRRTGLLTRKTVMHQASEHQPTPSTAAEGGRA